MHLVTPQVLIIAGPTGSGKSALAVDVAEALHGVVINADSMQVYRELRVLTARPGPADEGRAPHRLYGILPAAERCSVGRWLMLARTEIEQAWNEGLLPIVVGGTGLYLKALTQGLAAVPEISADVRVQVERLFAELGGKAFREALRRLDAEAAEKLPETDRQRLIRAYEVVSATGRTLSDWQRAAALPPLGSARLCTLVLLPQRSELYPDLDARFDRMMSERALIEVESLLALGLAPDLPAMKSMGVRELAGVIRGTSNLEEAVAVAKRATRRFAKRQETWLRHQVHADAVFSAQYSERIRAAIFAFIRRELLTPEAQATRFPDVTGSPAS